MHRKDTTYYLTNIPVNWGEPFSLATLKVWVLAEERTPRGSFSSFKVSVPVFLTIVVIERFSTSDTSVGETMSKVRPGAAETPKRAAEAKAAVKVVRIVDY